MWDRSFNARGAAGCSELFQSSGQSNIALKKTKTCICFLHWNNVIKISYLIKDSLTWPLLHNPQCSSTSSSSEWRINISVLTMFSGLGRQDMDSENWSYWFIEKKEINDLKDLFIFLPAVLKCFPLCRKNMNSFINAIRNNFFTPDHLLSELVAGFVCRFSPLSALVRMGCLSGPFTGTGHMLIT